MAPTTYPRRMAGRGTVAILLWATLITSALHFADNALRPDLYPGPAWLTRNVVLLAWLGLPVLGWAAYQSATRAGLAAYGLLGFAGLAHYLVPHHRAMPLRSAATILGEAIISLLLIAYVGSRGPYEPKI